MILPAFQDAAEIGVDCLVVCVVEELYVALGKFYHVGAETAESAVSASSAAYQRPAECFAGGSLAFADYVAGNNCKCRDCSCRGCEESASCYFISYDVHKMPPD